MKKLPVHIRAILLCILLAAAACTGIFLFSGFSDFPSQEVTADAEFEAFTNELFVQEVSSSTISLHYTLENPETYGITEPPITYGNLSTDSKNAQEFIQYYLNLLHTFDTDSLSDDNQLNYQVLDDYLRTSLKESEYLLYQEPLSPMTGTHAQLPVLLTEFPLRDMEDIEEYLALLSVTPEYFQSIADFEKEKSAQGLFCTDEVLDQVLSQCSDFIEMKDNYLISSFDERLEDVPGLSEKLRKKYRKQNRQLVTHSILPAYKMLMKELETLRGSGTNSQGLCNLPKGKDFYTCLVRSETGSDRSLDELENMISAQIASDLSAAAKIYDSSPNLRTKQPSITRLSPSKILTSLQKNLSKQFPSISKVSVNIKNVPESLEEHLSPAFYLIPPIDNLSSQVIYLNAADEMDPLELFTTLAHEGYPGHLYQNAWMNEHCESPLRKILNYGGYTEGWATYVEMCSYYASGLPDEEARLVQSCASANLGLYAYCDLMIHSSGWTVTDTAKFLKKYGITSSETVSAIYSLILGDPANYLKYYVGYLEFLELKKEARHSMPDFSESNFHQKILDTGPAPFSILREQLFSD